MSPTATVRSRRPVARSLTREVEEIDAALPFAAERTLPAREELGQPEPFHPRVRHRRRVAGQQRAVLDCCGRLRGMRGELPVARVGRREEANVVIGECLAPARQAGVDLRLGNTHGTKGAADVRGGGVTRDVWPLGVDPEHGFEREPARFHVHLVVRQQQRPVDVEQNEPGQAATTASTASRNVRTYRCKASGPSSATSTGREPTTMPSANSAAARACSGVEIPKPA